MSFHPLITERARHPNAASPIQYISIRNSAETSKRIGYQNGVQRQSASPSLSPGRIKHGSSFLLLELSSNLTSEASRTPSVRLTGPATTPQSRRMCGPMAKVWRVSGTGPVAGWQPRPSLAARPPPPRPSPGQEVGGEGPAGTGEGRDGGERQLCSALPAENQPLEVTSAPPSGEGTPREPLRLPPAGSGETGRLRQACSGFAASEPSQLKKLFHSQFHQQFGDFSEDAFFNTHFTDENIESVYARSFYSTLRRFFFFFPVHPIQNWQGGRNSCFLTPSTHTLTQTLHCLENRTGSFLCPQPPALTAQ
ncbi:uncharacterized protein LOC128567290 [Nycticebus coucang]|uniref:uncharacterized protein LOC128567290 n=1 Tax=Nycticebus coucang TaxID=9470 RepID=UPI00234D4AB9|nr:uncharacterized protein LOC128567290 [Nycticebus coucang]